MKRGEVKQQMTKDVEMENIWGFGKLEAVVELPGLPNSTKNVYGRVVHKSGNWILKVTLIITAPLFLLLMMIFFK